MKIISDTDPRN